MSTHPLVSPNSSGGLCTTQVASGLGIPPLTVVVTYQVVGEKMPRHRLEPAGGVTARPLGSKHRRGTLDVNPGADNGWDGALPFHSDFSNWVGHPPTDNGENTPDTL